MILVSRFLINLQEANLRSVKVDTDDPLHFTHSANTLPSFVAAYGANRAATAARPQEGPVDVDEGPESDGVDRGEGSPLGVGVPGLSVDEA